METNALTLMPDMLKVHLPSVKKETGLPESKLLSGISFRCYECNADFSMQEDLEKHIFVSHAEENHDYSAKRDVACAPLNKFENKGLPPTPEIPKTIPLVYEDPNIHCKRVSSTNVGAGVKSPRGRNAVNSNTTFTKAKGGMLPAHSPLSSNFNLANDREKSVARITDGGKTTGATAAAEQKSSLAITKAEESWASRCTPNALSSPTSAAADWLIASYLSAYPDGTASKESLRSVALRDTSNLNPSCSSSSSSLPAESVPTCNDGPACERKLQTANLSNCKPASVGDNSCKEGTSSCPNSSLSPTGGISVSTYGDGPASERKLQTVNLSASAGDTSCKEEMSSSLCTSSGGLKLTIRIPALKDNTKTRSSVLDDTSSSSSEDDDDDDSSSHSENGGDDLDGMSSDNSASSNETGFSKPDAKILGNDPDLTTDAVVSAMELKDESSARSNANNQVSLEVETDLTLNNSTSVGDVSAVTTPTANGKCHECEECGKSFKRSADLEQHSVVHTGEKAFKCELCDSVFSYKHSLRNHYLKHTGVKAYKCKVCDKDFANLSKLKSHSMIHSESKPYKCPTCDNAFRHKNTLTNHMVLHTGEKPYKCEVCGASFARKRYFKDHSMLHTGVRPYRCDICGTTYAHKSILKGHLLLHTGEKPFKCDKCDMAFAQKCYLKKHSFTHTEDKPHVCKECGATFKTKPRLNQHLIIHNVGEKVHKCGYCLAEFARKSDLNTHTRVHTGEKPFKCSECGATFTQRGHLKTHVLVHTAEKAYKCQFCDAAFVTRSSLVTHSRRHTGEKPYKCGYCGVAFGRKAHLNRHIMVHTGEKSYKCDTCESAFSEKSALIKHNRTHTGEKPYVCEVCSAGFTYSTGLNRHMRTHTGYKPYRCDICNISVAEKRTLRRHVLKNLGDNVHRVEDFKAVFPQVTKKPSSSLPATKPSNNLTIERNFKCSFCDATFTQGSTLKSHIRTHTGEKPYVCSECGARFAQNGLLRTHIRIHTGDKPFKCPECSAGFNQKGNLKTHLLTHSGNKPFKCQFCGASYTQKGNLERHVLVHSADKHWKCQQCGASFDKKGYLERHTSQVHECGDPDNESREEEDHSTLDDRDIEVTLNSKFGESAETFSENAKLAVTIPGDMESTETFALANVEASYN